MSKYCLLYVSVVIIFIFASCNGNQASVVDDSNHPIVTVCGQTLYKSEIDNILPKNLSFQDSLRQTDLYVMKWIDERLLYAKAEKNIIDKDAIDRQVDNYRKSLVIYSYQDRLLKQKLDTEVQENELQAYYNQNKELFSLNGSIIKGLYLKIPATSSQLSNFRKWYNQTNDKSIGNIENAALQHAVNYEYFYDRWVSLKDIMDKIPYQMGDEKLFLQKNKTVDVSDSSFVYLLFIKDYRMIGEDAPYEYAKSRIKDTFLEKRKKDFLNQINNDLYNEAQDKGDIKFYGQ